MREEQLTMTDFELAVVKYTNARSGNVIRHSTHVNKLELHDILKQILLRCT